MLTFAASPNHHIQNKFLLLRNETEIQLGLDFKNAALVPLCCTGSTGVRGHELFLNSINSAWSRDVSCAHLR